MSEPATDAPCERCQGNGEIVTDWERYRHPRDGDAGDEAVTECPDCDGSGRADPDDGVMFVDGEGPQTHIPFDEMTPEGKAALRAVIRAARSLPQALRAGSLLSERRGA